MGTNWGTGNSVWTWGRTSSLWGWWSPGTGCAGRWWSLLLWRYSRPAWTSSSAACCRWPCFGGRVGLNDAQRSLPTPTILWFCDSAFSLMGDWVRGRQITTSEIFLWSILFIKLLLLLMQSLVLILLLLIKGKYSHSTLTYSLSPSHVVSQLELHLGSKPRCFLWTRGIYWCHLAFRQEFGQSFGGMFSSSGVYVTL